MIKTILVVEEDEHHLQLCINFFINLGFKVTGVKSIKDAQESFLNQIPDLVITGCFFPCIDLEEKEEL